MNTPTSIGPGDIQGNILKGHGRKYSRLVFFRFGEDMAKSKRLVHDAANNAPYLGINSAELQQKQASYLRELKQGALVQPTELIAAASTPFRSLALSAAGLKALGHNRETLQVGSQAATDQFWDGTQLYGATALGDREPWSAAFEPEPHGVLLVAHVDQEECQRLAEKCRELLADPALYGATVIGIETGFRWTPQGGDTTYEPFGFADGFARTQFTVGKKSPLRHLLEGTDLGTVRNKTRPFEMALDRVMISEAGGFLGASFFVVRKIEQNVQAFYQAEAALREKLQLLPPPLQPDNPGALFVGRERNGAPLVFKGRDQPLAQVFHFGHDKTGSRCPFHAHIRKMNPRQIFSRIGGHNMADRQNQKAAQFVRRGMVFGDEAALRPDWRGNPEGAPTGGCGLLFMGYMSGIGGQFLQMLQSWAGAVDFPKIPAGADPLLKPSATWKWPQYEGLEVPTPAAFVTGRGVAYFVVLTLPILRAL